jgi:hypothetical protein
MLKQVQIRDPSPFDCAQGQDDDVKGGASSRWRGGNSRQKNKQRLEQATANAGILHYVQDDDFKGAVFFEIERPG